MIRCISMALLLAALAVERGEAQTRLLGTIGDKTPTVLSVIERLSCHPGWLSQAMQENGVKTLRPPRGTKIYLTTEACEKAPPPEIGRRSRALLSRQTEGPRPKPTPVAPPPLKEKEPEKPVSSVTPIPQGDRLVLERGRAEEGPLQLAILGLYRNSRALSGLGLIVLGLVLGLGGMWVKHTDQISFKKIWRVKDGPDRFPYELASVAAGPGRIFQSRYKCPRCGEEMAGRLKDLEEHARNKCPNKRVVSNATH